MKRCVLFGGGPWEDFNQVEWRKEPEDYLIACDAGYLAAQRMGVTPDLVVGDFDSIKGKIDPGPEVYTVPARKDDTDTMLGVKLGLERGYREFLLLGAFGGRLDHTMANLQTLSFLCLQGARGEIRSNHNWAWAVKDGSLRIPAMEGWHLSVFAMDTQCEGVTLEGLSYPLKDGEMTCRFPLGVSNEFEGPEAVITVKKGILLVVASQERPNY